MTTGVSRPEGLERVAQSSLVDALVVMDVELHDERVPVLRELPMPSVLIGYPADADRLTCIDLDFVAAGAHCVDHLADLGHRSLALLGTPSAVYERQTGFAQRTLTGFVEAADRAALRLGRARRIRRRARRCRARCPISRAHRARRDARSAASRDRGRPCVGADPAADRRG